jgi:nucleotidyltransferase substrate binding protein (TIGR01987 family)
MNEIIKLADLKSALKSLKEGVGKATDDLDRDGVIQRFEFTFELLWKVIQEYAKYKGIESASPRDAFRVAGDLGIIDNPNIWFEFLKDRNLTTHLYSEEDAAKIFSHIPNFIVETEKIILKTENNL